MKKNRSLLAGAAAFGLIALVPALAQTYPPSQQQSGRTGSQQQTGTSQVPGQTTTGSTTSQAKRLTADVNFLMKAAQSNMAEVELGKLATQKASHEAVKQFGQTMVDDHTQANSELKQIASSKNIDFPTGIASKHQAIVDRLSKLSGAEFDRAYMSEMVKEHKQAVTSFKQEAATGADPDVKAFAAKTTPTLQQHLQQAEAIHSELQATTKSKTPPKGKMESETGKPDK